MKISSGTKRVFIVHGYTGHPQKNWFPWLKKQLEDTGVSVEVSVMPHPEAPVPEEWLEYLASRVGVVDENTYFVGHSLGCISILRFLESLSDGQVVGGAFLVAGFADKIHLSELDGFFSVPLRDEAVRARCKQILAINSDNDEHVPLSYGKELVRRFGAELIVVHNGGHLNEKSGYVDLPILFEAMKRVMRI